MHLSYYTTLGCVAFLLFCSHFPSTNGQCASTIGCADCFSWCQAQAGACHVPLVQSFCRKTCKTCSPDSPVCNAMNCDHRCILSNAATTATCECFDGYRLQSDKKSCKEIDECKENPRICDGIAAKCVNLPGTYKCSECEVAQNGITSYYSNVTQCCKINSATGCGKSVNNKPGRVVGGTNARIEAWPWQVYIKIQDRICGGSLITENYVLTAGHCVGRLDLNALTIFAGVYNTSDDGNIFEQSFRPKTIYRHPNYSFPNYDVAIIQLDHPANLNQYVNTICLPGGDQPKVGEICYATGYGLTSFRGVASETLQEVPLPIVDDTVCQKAYRTNENLVFPNIQMCAGYSAGGRDTCQGDSGGPLVCQRCNNCDWYIVGVSSFGKECARAGYYGVYTRITAFESWITGITNQQLTSNMCIKPTWASWSAWTACDATCGKTGTTKRLRSCQNGVAGDPGCEGKNVETKDCTSPSCQKFSQWSVYGSCSATCGGGEKTRTRQCSVSRGCQPDAHGDAKSQSVPCNTEVCPGVWSAWKNDGECSVTCGKGKQAQTRQCIGGVVGGVGCAGSDNRRVDCALTDCPEWGPFGAFGDCSVTCGGGTQSRSRTCVGGAIGTGNCIGSATDARPCNNNACPDNGNTCGGLVNLIDGYVCVYYANLNYCLQFKTYMTTNCRLTCCQKELGIGPFKPNYCGNIYTDSSCALFAASCADINVQRICQKTCGLCT